MAKTNVAGPEPPASALPLDEDDEAHPFESTLTFDPDALNRALAPPPVAEPVFERTQVLSHELLGVRPASPPRVDVPASPLPDPVHPLDSTIAFDPEVLRSSRPATPFHGGPSSAPPPVAPLVLDLASLFSPPPAPLVQDVPVAVAPTFAPRVEEAPAPVAMAVPIPSPRFSPHVPGPTSAQPAEAMTFGAHFLAAMDLLWGPGA